MHPMDRFFDKVNISDGCWEWTAGKNPKGYGIFFDGKRNLPSHRWLYMQVTRINLPSDIFVCHRCDNPGCVNPYHMFAGTSSDNSKDAAAKGRNAMQRHPERSSLPRHRKTQVGAMNLQAKLTDKQIIEIRELYWVTKNPRHSNSIELATKYGVTRSTIWKAVNGKQWSHVNAPAELRAEG